jgi:hypothetical protein
MPRQTQTQDPEPESQAIPMPGFQPIPDPLPGPANPDPRPDGAASVSSGPAAPTRIEIPKARVKSYSGIAKGLLHALGGLVNRAVAVDEDDTAFLPDDDDDATIPPPLGRLAARRVPIGKDGDDFSDIEDIAMSVIGLLAWAAKGLTDHLNARRERGPAGRRIKGQVMFDGDEDQDQDQDQDGGS